MRLFVLLVLVVWVALHQRKPPGGSNPGNSRDRDGGPPQRGGPAAADDLAGTQGKLFDLAEDARPAGLGSTGQTTPSSTTVPMGQRIDDARGRVGTSPDGTQVRAEWLRSDGSTTPMQSGKQDPYFREANDFLRNNEALSARDRAMMRSLSHHVEVKVAVQMHRRGDQSPNEETVVIDRQVCGTRDYDRDLAVTCDRFLPRFLPPGARLTVVEPDGNVRTYVGEAS